MLMMQIFVAVFGGISTLSVEGNWQCDPYEILGESFEGSVAEIIEYKEDGSFVSESTARYVFPDQFSIEVRVDFRGKWRIEDSLLLKRTVSSSVIRTNAEWLPVEKMQEFFDRSAKPLEWLKYDFEVSGGELVTTLLAPDKPELEKSARCVKA